MGKTTLQYIALQCSTVQCSTLKYRKVWQCSKGLQYITGKYSSKVQCSTVLQYCTIEYSRCSRVQCAHARLAAHAPPYTAVGPEPGPCKHGTVYTGAHCTATLCITVYTSQQCCTDQYCRVIARPAASTPSTHLIGSLYCTQVWKTSIVTKCSEHCTALHCTTLHCTALHCTALHCTALYSTVQYYSAVLCIYIPSMGIEPPTCPGPSPSIPSKSRSLRCVYCTLYCTVHCVLYTVYCILYIVYSIHLTASVHIHAHSTLL